MQAGCSWYEYFIVLMYGIEINPLPSNEKGMKYFNCPPHSGQYDGNSLIHSGNLLNGDPPQFSIFKQPLPEFNSK